nr:hypothetical protein Ade03nite_70270 [Actinoplanes derwentensis]
MTLLLVPLAVAGAAAIKAASDRGADGVCQVRTRMRDVTLLADALRDTGATVTTADDRMTAVWGEVGATFACDTEGIWGAHFTGADQARAVELVTATDAAYGRRVQQTVLERLRDQAPAAGLRLESETVDDNAGVRLVFEVERT